MSPEGNRWILAVEDSESDTFLLQRAIDRGPEPEPVVRVGDGEKAIEFLKQLAEGEIGCLPNLIIIDINLPRASGYEVLQLLSTLKAFRQVPIVVATSSQRATDRERALAEGADAFFAKSLDLALYSRLPDIIREARKARTVRGTLK